MSAPPPPAPPPTAAGRTSDCEPAASVHHVGRCLIPEEEKGALVLSASPPAPLALCLPSSCLSAYLTAQMAVPPAAVPTPGTRQCQDQSAPAHLSDLVQTNTVGLLNPPLDDHHDRRFNRGRERTSEHITKCRHFLLGPLSARTPAPAAPTPPPAGAVATREDAPPQTWRRPPQTWQLQPALHH